MEGGNKKWKDLTTKESTGYRDLTTKESTGYRDLTTKESTGYRDLKAKAGYIQLAQAIITSGVKANDQSFLQSDWCDTLHQLVVVGMDKNTVVDRGYLCNIV